MKYSFFKQIFNRRNVNFDNGFFWPSELNDNVLFHHTTYELYQSPLANTPRSERDDEVFLVNAPRAGIKWTVQGRPRGRGGD